MKALVLIGLIVVCAAQGAGIAAKPTDREKPKAVILDKRARLDGIEFEYPRLARFPRWLQRPEQGSSMLKGKPFLKATTAFRVAVTPANRISELHAFRVFDTDAKTPRLEWLNVQSKGEYPRREEWIVSVPECEKGDYLLLLMVISENKPDFGDVK